MTRDPDGIDTARARATSATLGQRAAQAMVVGLAAWLLSACGGGGGDPPAPVTPVTPITPVTAHHVVTLDHGAFQLLYDCDEHSTLRYAYTLDVDLGNAARPTQFGVHDPLMPAGCAEQTSNATYASVAAGWDRGHLVTANHMDLNDAQIASTFTMSNVVPQRAAFNQGIWADAEAIAECYRDLAPVQVVGGVVYGDTPVDTANDLFVASHGIRTPDAFWKVLITTERSSGAVQVIAWLIPNDAGLGPLDSYLVSVATLEAQVGADRVALADLAPALKARQPAQSWPLPVGCNPG